jgi:hypothetical protein
MRAAATIALITLGACDRAPADPIDAGSIADARSPADASSDAVANERGPDDVWAPLSHLAMVDPTEHGADPTGGADAVDAIGAAIDALPEAGGIVRFPAGTFLKDHRLLYVRRDHVLLWAPNQRATIFSRVRLREGEKCGPREAALVFDRTVGGGIFGLRVDSDVVERTSCAEDAGILYDGVRDIETVGVELSGSGMFVYNNGRGGHPPSEGLFFEGNFIHDTWADTLHHTAGARRSTCWGNWAIDGGDDGIACVTYGVSSPRCRELEFFGNVVIGGHARGLTVVGGEDVSIHHNWVIGTRAAGILAASESAYDSASVARVTAEHNWLVRSPDGTVDNGHSAILVSGGNSEAEPIREVRAANNVILDPAGDRYERAEGSYDEETVIFEANSRDAADLPGEIPAVGDAVTVDTSVLRTRDTSFVAEDVRRGLYRIHVRESAAGAEERFEYVVRGPTELVQTWTDDEHAAGAYVSETREVGDESYAVLLSSAPLAVPQELQGVSFAELRAGDRDGGLAWLWTRLDVGAY